MNRSSAWRTSRRVRDTRRARHAFRRLRDARTRPEHRSAGTLGIKAPDASRVAGRDVLLVHPWSLCERPDSLPAGTLSIAPGELPDLRIADIGCGAGLMCEPLAAQGARVVGVDAAQKNVAIAQAHASGARLDIDYRAGEPANALRDGELFDVLLLLEVVEHADDVAAFMRQAARYLRPGGLLLASTINMLAWCDSY